MDDLKKELGSLQKRVATLEQDNVRLEERFYNHVGRFKDLHNDFKKMSELQKSTNQTLTQIKWLAMGAAAFFVISQIGLTEALKKIIF